MAKRAKIKVAREPAKAHTRVAGANSYMIGGSHYKNRGQEHWDRAVDQRWDPFQYQITKYVERWRAKDGIKDLYKTRHFLDKYIELVEARRYSVDDGFNVQTAAEAAEPSSGYVSQDSDS